MEQWEHMAVLGLVTDEALELIAFRPNGTSDVLDTGDVGLGRVMRALTELGQQGWQLVTSNVQTSDEGGGSVTHYLKRPIESDGGWAETTA